MHKIKTIHILIFTLLFMASCGGKKSNSKLSIDLSSLTGAGASATGGLLLVGHKLDDSASFSRAYSANDANPVFELENGTWEFFVTFWDGSSNLEGGAHCSYAGPFELNGTEQNISFNTSKAKCTQPIPDGSYVSIDANAANENTFPFFSITSCLLNATSCSNAGLTNSFYVTLTSETKNFPSTGPAFLKSNCHLPGEQLTIPSGDAPGTGGGILTATIYLFTTTDCTGNPVKYEMKDGLKNNITETDFQTKYFYSSGVINLKVVHNLSTSTSNLAPSPYGNGAQGNDISIEKNSMSLINFSADGTTATIPSSSFQVGDEIMWHVIKFTTGQYECGPLKTGQYGFQRIKNITTAGYDTLEFFKSIKDGVDLSSINYTNCKIQIVKVPNYNNLSISSNQTANSLGSGTSGGILVARIKGTLTIDATISASDLGLLNDAFNVDYYDCSDASPCLKMGVVHDSFTGQGGGAIMLFAEKINFQSNALLRAGTSAYGTTGGTISLIAKEVYSDDLTNVDLSLFDSDTAEQFPGGPYDNAVYPSGVDSPTPGFYYNVINASSSSTSGFTPYPVLGMPSINTGDTLFFTGSSYIWNPTPQALLMNRGGEMSLNYCAIAGANNGAINPPGVYSAGNFHNGVLKVNYSLSHCQ